LDVTAKKILSREVPSNPSNPVYKIRDDKGNLIEYGEITGSRPKIAYFKTDKNICDMALKSKDINGNSPGTRTKGNFHTRERRSS
jgi:hypothetical protein